jgi:hypothetical protein
MKTLDDLMADLTPDELTQVHEKVAAMRLDSQLYKLREALSKTQKRYVEALGGQLTIGVNMPGGEHVDFTL